MAELQSLKLPELKAKCKERGLKNYSKLSKQQLIDLLTGVSGVTNPAITTTAPTTATVPPPSKTKRPLEGETLAAQAALSGQDTIKVSKKKKVTGKETTEAPAPLPPAPSRTLLADRNASPTVFSAPASKAAAATPVQSMPIEEVHSKSIRTQASQEHATPGHSNPSVAKKAGPAPISSSTPPATSRPPSAINPQKSTQGNKTSVSPSKLTASRPAPTKFIPLTSQPVPLPSTQPANKKDSVKKSTKSPSTLVKHPKVVLRRVPKPAPVKIPTPVTSPGLALQDCIDAKTRKEYLDMSFLPVHCIDPEITEGFVVSIRFCISRAHIDHNFPTVKKAVRISKDVWKLSTEIGDVHVLEATGESLGKELRTDWAEWVKGDKTLESVIRTKDMPDFPQGIARTFHGDRIIARRAVLSGCAAESYCGPKLELAQIDSEWLGRPGDIQTRTKRVQLYLPESKQVMSINTENCHPALAMVHRSTGFTDIVLRETGQVVGDENGLEEMWQKVLHVEE